MLYKIVKKQLYLILLFISLFFSFRIFMDWGSDSTFDINVHDTYFVVERGFVALAFAILFFVLFTIYWTFDKMDIKLYSVLSKIHIYGTLLSLVGMYFPYYLFRPKYSLEENDFFDINVIIALSGILFLLVNVGFALNIIIGVLKKIKALVTQ